MATLPSGIGRSISTPPLSWNAKHSTKARSPSPTVAAERTYSPTRPKFINRPARPRRSPRSGSRASRADVSSRRPAASKEIRLSGSWKSASPTPAWLKTASADIPASARIESKGSNGPTRAKPEAPADERETVMAGIGDGSPAAGWHAAPSHRRAGNVGPLSVRECIVPEVLAARNFEVRWTPEPDIAPIANRAGRRYQFGQERQRRYAVS